MQTLLGRVWEGVRCSMPGARRHHYIPQFYLEGFKRSADDKGLWVTDTQRAVQFEAVTKDIGVQRDYNRVEISGVEPNVVEEKLSQIEARAANVIRTLASSRVLPTDDDLNDLMVFIALLHTRSPSSRQVWGDGLKKVAEMAEIMKAASEEEKRKWSRVPAMPPDSKGVSYSEFSKVFKADGTHELRNEANVEFMLEGAKVVAPLLIQRSWTVLVARKDAGDLICSDHPVSLVWTDAALMKQSFYSPGFGLRNTVVTVPLTRRIALWGSWGSGRRVSSLGPRDVAAINSRTAMYAQRHIYSARRDFDYIDKLGRVLSSKALLRQILSSTGSLPGDGMDVAGR
ncbi:MAG: DUF4238 domain-containing protein [Symbiobacteriia bacterium]